jgi:hypothetical protein
MAAMNVGAPRPLCDLYYSPEGDFKEIAEQFTASTFGEGIAPSPPFCLAVPHLDSLLLSG